MTDPQKNKNKNQNPYDALDLDPSLSLADLTEHLRDLAETSSPEARSHIQGLWQRLTLRRDDRIRAALLARPRPATSPPPLALARRLRPPAPADLDLTTLCAQLQVEELLVWPRYQAPTPATTPQHTHPNTQQKNLWPHDKLSDDPFFD